MLNFFHSIKKFSVGILVLRIIIGLLLMIHGLPKIMGGTLLRGKLGGAVSIYGITIWPELRGFLASFAEFFGGLFLILGFITPVTSFLIFFTMMTASLTFLINGQIEGNTLLDYAKFITTFSHPLSWGAVALMIMISGPGVYSFDRLIFKK